MLRVCGATAERDALSAARCWCGGLFCGRGGFKQSKDFRRAFRSAATAPTWPACQELMQQEDLFDGPAQREKWFERVYNRRAVAHRAPGAGAARARAAG